MAVPAAALVERIYIFSMLMLQSTDVSITIDLHNIVKATATIQYCVDITKWEAIPIGLFAAYD